MSTKLKKKKSIWKIVLVVVLTIILIVALVSGFLLSHYAGLFGDLRDSERGTDPISASNEPQITPTSNVADDVFSILLIGVDSRENTYTGRSDTQMLFSVNQKQKKVVITSLLRDCYVTIPGHGNNRINAAYSFGGASLLTQTIHRNFGIPVNRCAVVNFQAVSDFINAVGGVDVDLSEAEIAQIRANSSGPLTNPGVNHLNGEQAVAYARIRKVDNDFGRTKRQRVVVEEALEKFSAMSLTQQSTLLQQFLPRVHTDLTKSEVINIGSLILRLRNYQVQSFAIPVDGTWSDMNVNGMDVLDVDYATNRRAWEEAVS